MKATEVEKNYNIITYTDFNTVFRNGFEILARLFMGVITLIDFCVFNQLSWLILWFLQAILYDLKNGILIRRQGFDSIFIDVILSEMKWYLNESKKVFLFVPSSQLIVVFILICNE